MSTSAPSLNDSWRFRRAVALLDREQLTPSEQWRFAWLNRSIWSVLVLSLVWPVTVMVSDQLQLLPLVLFLSAIISAVFFFIANLGLLLKFFRAAGGIEWRLGISAHVSALTGRVAVRKGWRAPWTRTTSVILLAVGVLFAGLGGLALSEELRLLAESTAKDMAADVAVLILGLACLSLIPLNRIRRRLAAISQLREAMLAQPRSERDAHFNSAELRFMSTLERTEILLARDEAAAANRSAPRAAAARFAQPFQVSLSRLEGHEIARVYETVQQLHERPNADGDRVAVAGTSLEIGFRRDADTRELVAESLYRDGRALHPESETGRTP